MNKRNYPLDPDDADRGGPVEDALSESLAPLPLLPERARALKGRLMARVQASRAAGRELIKVRLEDGEWRQLLPGVRVKCLDAGQRAVLLDLAPGAALPIHRHHEDEECVVLRGEATLGEIGVHRGDYHLARPGSRHGVVRSATGALLYLRGTPIGHGGEVVRDLLTAWLPGRGAAPLTVRADEGEWEDLGPGVQAKLLRRDAQSRSRLVRIAPGATVSGPLAGECLMMEGDAFFEDWLMRPGDYQLVPEGAPQLTVESDAGALLFVRAAVEERP